MDMGGRLLRRFFGEPEITGLQSDAYWLALFVGPFATFTATFLLAFLLLPTDTAVEVGPVLFVVALVLSYPLTRYLQRVFSRIFRAVEAVLYPHRDIDEPRL